MYKLKYSSLFDIQLFAEGGGDGGGTGAGAAGEGPAGAEGAVAQPTGDKRNPLSGVQYGKQEPAPDAGVQQVESDDRNAQFEALIKGEYKDLYDQRVQDTIQKRLKNTSETIQKYQALTGVLQMLGDKYGVDTNDVTALTKAIEDDESFYEEEALEKGLTVQQVKEIRKMQRENEALKAEMQQRQMQAQADQVLARWNDEAAKVKQIYPGFDLENELKNPAFRGLLTSNVPVQTAFEVIHKDEIFPAAMQYTAQKITEKVSNSIRAGQQRPAEAAMGNRSTVTHKSDVSQLTRADRDEIDRRVARGERIIF